MNQKRVFEVLKEIGGKGRMKDIYEYGVKKYPDEFYQRREYISAKLMALRKWGFVTRNRDNVWHIVREYSD